jgi:hypothetical protein
VANSRLSSPTPCLWLQNRLCQFRKPLAHDCKTLPGPGGRVHVDRWGDMAERPWHLAPSSTTVSAAASFKSERVLRFLLLCNLSWMY